MFLRHFIHLYENKMIHSIHEKYGLCAIKHYDLLILNHFQHTHVNQFYNLQPNIYLLMLLNKSIRIVSKQKFRNSIIEFGSINPNGPIHLGHMCNVVWGETIARCLELKKSYLVNDTGKQIYDNWHRIVNQKNTRNKLEKIILDLKLNLQQFVYLWQQYNEAVLQQFGIKYDIIHHESSMLPQIENLTNLLKPYWRIDNHKTFLNIEPYNRYCIKNENGPTYLLKDMAWIKYILDSHTHLIMVIGADHAGHFDRVKSSMNLLSSLTKKNYNGFTYIKMGKVYYQQGTTWQPLSKRQGVLGEREDNIWRRILSLDLRRNHIKLKPTLTGRSLTRIRMKDKDKDSRIYSTLFRLIKIRYNILNHSPHSLYNEIESLNSFVIPKHHHLKSITTRFKKQVYDILNFKKWSLPLKTLI